MKLTGALTDNLALKGLALFLAAALWFSLTLSQEKVASIMVPVVVKNVPPMMTVTGTPPRFVECEISGPKIALMGMGGEQLSVTLDLTGAGEGSVSFANLDRTVRLRRGLRLVRVQPASIELRLVKEKVESGAPPGP